ncbi:MAG: hypothetical protein JOZ62_07710 [Acidobacteriaceae bacterium]|nr:hypothetical protein [Acidobacteriaceae bacterium]
MFTVVSNSEIEVTVPSGATTGAIQVKTPNGVLTSNANFQVLNNTTGLFTAIDLGTLGATNTIPEAINNSGQVVGQSQTPTGTYHAFLYRGGAMQDLGTLSGDMNNAAYAINNAGQIAGCSGCAQNGPTFYGSLNAAVAGAHAFLYRNGTMVAIMETLLSLPDCSNPLTFPCVAGSSASGINDSGQSWASNITTASREDLLISRLHSGLSVHQFCKGAGANGASVLFLA